MRPRVWLPALLAFGVLAAPPQAARADAMLSAEIKAGKTVGARTLRVRQGEQVSLTVASDARIVLHLHGYDLERTVEPGKPAVFEFTARATGRFPIEPHGATKHGAALLYIEVLPR